MWHHPWVEDKARTAAAPGAMASLRAQWCWCWCHRHLSIKLILVLLTTFLILPLITHYYLSNMGSDCDTDNPSHISRNKLDYDPDEEKKIADFKNHIEELKAIKASVNNELRDLENKRQSLQTEIAGYTSHIDNLKSQYNALKKEISQVKLSLDQLKFEKEETNAYVPSIKAPQRIIFENSISETMAPPSSPSLCRMESCFDFSRCSLVSGFPVFFYDPEDYETVDALPIEDFVLTSVVSSLSQNMYVTDDPSSACIFIVLVGEARTGPVSREKMERVLQGLPHWNGDGRNHLLFNLARSHKNTDYFKNVNTGRALVAQSSFLSFPFRNSFDILIPPSKGHASGDVWSELPPLSPARNKFLVSFWGEYIPSSERKGQQLRYPQYGENEDYREQGRNLKQFHESQKSRKLLMSVKNQGYYNVESAIVTWLKDLQSKLGESSVMHLACGSSNPEGLETEWGLCGEPEQRKTILMQSTFTLLIFPLNDSLTSTNVFQTRLYEALKYGAIPVILGLHRRLPFDEILDWDKAVLTLPLPRVTEIPFFLRTFSDNDITQLRHHGRFLWESYFGSTQRILDTTLAVLRARLQIPALPSKEEPSVSVFNATFVPLKIEGPGPEPESDEVLGPIEPRFPSKKFQRNYTQSWVRQSFNVPGDPFSLYPFTPFEPLLPSEAKFLGSPYGFRPVGLGAGGAGKEFSEALGGNVPREQFTIVMLTYERETVLIQALQRLKGLPFLNKVLVVWNNPLPPSTDLRWPDIGVPLQVLRTKRNSLNNRFLPYESIETEAVLSIDDDAHLRHDEIVFGFRVWREERDRVVGFPGRFHAWDAKHHTWHYNSNYSCELSMVLTGAAFFHKYYAYLYSYVMPQAIRDMVDRFTNCEDIAMNFLVSHITRKPPIKVTSRWTFRCPGCPNTLSSNDTHFEERHSCMNFFVQVYGYMPLLFTQYRVDSVLFKTRLPHDKQKCFKYI
ncbi:exostosin-like 3 [Babylonia areolata]|uniref:exostosin-like 3 n=1 Tax=Babylonia areolata TaxID=304850 RepID=UPI003FD22F3D